MAELSYLSKLPFWEQLTDSEKEFVQVNSHIQRYSKEQVILNSDMECLGMSMVLSGELRACILSEEGREITLYRLHEGGLCILTASCAVKQITFETQMTVSANCDLLVMGTAAFEKLINQNIYVRCFAYELLCERFSSVMWTMQMILFRGYDRRLASFLIGEYEHTGSPVIQMTHEQIAQYTSSAREVVARMLKRFSADGLVEFKRGRITLKNIDALKAMV
ncbi:Crp/Fnr family transcriptional regulator [Christensenella tenuis]|uniref:Crp/Fnr family transcriptional regulator n=1 Tax=Christensenella tenuis TaxID=2763033 RepID=A0ABR7EIA4_9FIRM|nr:Crp/Fnr family transcriptional regulator [Christensenella tenuis]MBC5649418.1 Crp/Fnr family transcriptional regulator [Christensenella tenuis]